MKIPRIWLLCLPASAVGLAILLSFEPTPPAIPRATAYMDDAGVPAPAPGFLDEDYRRHVAQVRKKLPGEGFTIVVRKPFVVIGDEAPQRVRQRASSTVQWASDKLKASYFESDPKQILDVWLFKDRESYEKNAARLFGRLPETKFGFYSSADRALVMNIATGGGTLVHEMVHAFMDANFPDCPPWFNEGLGSLYEQCAERDGRIVGLLNWRLPILKRAIRAEDLPGLRALTSMNGAAFYGPNRGVNYSMARYLLYRLQEEGLLLDYYRKFREDRKRDPTGYGTLVGLLEEEDPAAWQKAWEAWVLDL